MGGFPGFGAPAAGLQPWRDARLLPQELACALCQPAMFVIARCASRRSSRRECHHRAGHTTRHRRRARHCWRSDAAFHPVRSCPAGSGQRIELRRGIGRWRHASCIPSSAITLSECAPAINLVLASDSIMPLIREHARRADSAHSLLRLIAETRSACGYPLPAKPCIVKRFLRQVDSVRFELRSTTSIFRWG